MAWRRYARHTQPFSNGIQGKRAAILFPFGIPLEDKPDHRRLFFVHLEVDNVSFFIPKIIITVSGSPYRNHLAACGFCPFAAHETFQNFGAFVASLPTSD